MKKFEKYSNSRDFILAGIMIIALFIISLITSINLFNFDTEKILDILLNFTGMLIGFILTIITLLFMFDPTKNPIFKKLNEQGIYKQIFQRFFDTLIAISISFLFFLTSAMYYTQGEYSLNGLIINLGSIINLFILLFTLWIIIRIWRSLNLLGLLYKAVNYSK